MILASFIPRGGFNITPSDSEDLPAKAYGIFCKGTGGLVSGVCDDDTVLTDMPIESGSFLPFIFKKITEDTTATGLVGCNAWK